MPSSAVTLGGITLQGHEVPEKIPFGGRQKLVRQKLVGGRRVVDAMGPEEGDRHWEGRFRGPSALARARAIDAMRRAGAQVPLSWGGLSYTVTIEEFEADYRRSSDIPYRIRCCVVDDDGPGAGDAVGDLDALVGSDLGDALGAVAFLPAAAADALAALQGAVGAAGASLADLAPDARIPVQDLAFAAVGALDGAVSSGDAALAGFDALDTGVLAAPQIFDALASQADAAAAQAAATAARALAGRIDANLDTAAG